MSAYIVRVIKTQEVVAIAWGKTRREIYNVVDELTYPSACEYARLPVGGFLFKEDAATIPHPFPDDDEGPEAESRWEEKFFGRIELSHMLFFAVSRNERADGRPLNWKRFCADADQS